MVSISTNPCQISGLFIVASTCSAESKKELLTYCSPCCVCYIAALLGGRILRIRNIAEGRLCAKCLRSGGTGSTSAISVSRVRKEELSNKVAPVLLENARLPAYNGFVVVLLLALLVVLLLLLKVLLVLLVLLGRGEVLTVAAES